MDVDEEHLNVDVGMLVLQQTQALSDKQSHMVDQQEMLIRTQKDIQHEVQQLQILTESSRRRKRSKPHRNTIPSGDADADDADDEGDESADETKEKMPPCFHVSPF